MVDLINLSDVVQAVVSSYIEQNSNIKANFDIENNVKVKGDRKLIQIVIHNLIDSAIKYSSKKEKPFVIFGKVEGEEIFFVKDNGTCIDSNVVSEYYSVQEPPEKIKIVGASTGLIVASQMITAYGGNIWVERKGSTWTIIYFTIR